MACVITLTGPSGCGKSTIINVLKKIEKERGDELKFRPTIIKKFTTREFRKNELELVEKNKEEQLDIKSVYGKDNIVKNKNGEVLPEKEQHEIRKYLLKRKHCDLMYEQYGNQYGIHLSELYECLKKGETPIVILNDIRTVEDVKVYFGSKCVSLFIFRKAPSLEEYQQIGKERNSSNEEIENRYRKATAIYRIYIENIHIFDKLILNVQEGDESLYNILTQLIENINEPPVLFE